MHSVMRFERPSCFLIRGTCRRYKARPRLALALGYPISTWPSPLPEIDEADFPF